MSRRAAPKSEPGRHLNIGAKAASFASSSERATPLSEHCNKRGIFITSCQTIRDWCTMFMFKFRRAQSCRNHRGVTTKSLFVWKRGNRATSIPKAKSSKSLEPQLRPESTCCRSSGNMICPLSFQRVFSMKRIEFRKQSNKNSSKSAKICAINSSSRSIRMTREKCAFRQKRDPERETPDLQGGLHHPAGETERRAQSQTPHGVGAGLTAATQTIRARLARSRFSRSKSACRCKRQADPFGTGRERPISPVD